MNCFRCALHGTLKSEKSGYVTLTTKIFAPGACLNLLLPKIKKNPEKKFFCSAPFKSCRRVSLKQPKQGFVQPERGCGSVRWLRLESCVSVNRNFRFSDFGASN